MAEDPLDELEIHALADGWLGADDQKRVQQKLVEDPALRRKYDAVLAQKQLLKDWWLSEQPGKHPEKPRPKKAPKSALVPVLTH